MEQPTAQFSDARVTILTVALASGCGAALLALASDHAAHPAGPLALIALATAFFAAEVFPMHFGVGEDRHTISFNELPLAIGVIVLGPAALVVSVILGSGVALRLHRRQRGTKLAFNLSQLAVQAIVAVAVFDGIRHGALPSVSTYAAIALAVVVADSVSAVLVTCAIALYRGSITGVIRTRALLGGALQCLPKAVLVVGAVAAIAYDNSAALITVIDASSVAYIAYRYHAARRGMTEPLAAST